MFRSPRFLPDVPRAFPEPPFPAVRYVRNQYVRNHWEALIVYVNDGGLPIDNNPVERLMKRIAIGRKNWLIVGYS